MAEKQVTVKVVSEVDDSEVTALEEQINNMNDSTVTVNTDNSEIETLTSDIENLEDIIEEEKAYGFDTTESEQELESLKSRLEELKTEAETPSSIELDTTNAETGINGLQDSLDGFSMMMVGEVLQQYGSSAEDLAQQMNAASISVGQLATQTGIAEPEMVNLINHISNATFPNDEAMMYVKSLDQMGVSAGNLGKSATDLDKINDAFGLGAGKVNSLGQELGVLGVDMNNVSTAFNSLAYANSNTVGGMDNYFNFLRRFDADLNELGYNADQTAIIIAGATQKYGGGRAALTGLSSALKEAGNDSKALEQALGLQAGSLSNASQITGEYEGQLQTMAKEEMEHKTWLDQLGAAWEDLSLSISGGAQPFMSLFGLSGQIAGFGMQLNGTWELLSKFRDISVISNLGSALSGSLSTMTGAFSSLWGVLIANPITLVIIAIVALIAVLGYLYFNNEQVRAAIDGLGQTFMWVGQIIYTSFINALNWIIGALQNFYNYVMTLGGLLPNGVNVTGNQIIDSILAFLVFFATLPIQIGVILLNTLAKVFGFKGNFVQSVVSAATNAVNGFRNAINGIVQAVQNCLNWAYNIFMNHPIVQAAQWLGNQISNAFSALGLGQHSPGKIYKAMHSELDWTSELMQDNNLINDASRLGSDVVDAFGNPSLGVDTSFANSEFLNAIVSDESNANGSQTLIFNISDNVIDDDKRMDKIVDEITRRLAFNNETAGRTV